MAGVRNEIVGEVCAWLSETFADYNANTCYPPDEDWLIEAIRAFVNELLEEQEDIVDSLTVDEWNAVGEAMSAIVMECDGWTIQDALTLKQVFPKTFKVEI